MRMSQDDRTAQEKLTPEARRELLRAYADRMLLKVSAMDDPEDMPGVEKAVRVAAGIERIYYRCDRAENHTPDPRKLEAERATYKREALKARVSLAGTLKWGEERRQDLGKWWDAADTTAQTQTLAQIPTPATAPQPAQTRPEIQTEPLATQGAALHASLSSLYNKTVDKPFEKPPQTVPEDIAAANRLLKAHAALKRGDISEDELDDFDEELDDWLQDRSPPD